MEQINIQLIERIVPDTSVIIEGLLSEKVRNSHIKSNEIIIHEAVIAELEQLAKFNHRVNVLLQAVKNSERGIARGVVCEETV